MWSANLLAIFEQRTHTCGLAMERFPHPSPTATWIAPARSRTWMTAITTTSSGAAGKPWQLLSIAPTILWFRQPVSKSLWLWKMSAQKLAHRDFFKLFCIDNSSNWYNILFKENFGFFQLHSSEVRLHLKGMCMQQILSQRYLDRFAVTASTSKM
jgi:hypothetical protein